MPLSKIISIGDELLIGQVINSNAAFLSEKLFTIGLPVKRTVTIGDNEKDLVEELYDSMKNFDVTIITGGLGPTHDDLTKPILVKFFGDELVINENVLDNVKAIFKNRGIKMPEANKEQALVPKNCNIIWNPNGTAPGLCYEREGRFVIALPGVPHEIYPMVDNSVLPLLKEKFTDRIVNSYKMKTILTAGVGESILSEMIGDIKEITGDDNLAFLPSAGSVRLRIDVIAEDEITANNRIEIIENKLKEKIGNHIFGINDDTLEKVLGGILRKKK